MHGHRCAVSQPNETCRAAAVAALDRRGAAHRAAAAVRSFSGLPANSPCPADNPSREGH